MLSARLTETITIKTPTTSKNAIGTPTRTLTELLTTRAGVKYMTGGERLNGDYIAPYESVIFTIRKRAGITNESVVSWDGKDYEIQAIQKIGRTGLKLICKNG